MASNKDFFKEQTNHSRVKSEIAVKYFFAWAKIVGGKNKPVYYMDLFSGTGKFDDDGNHSTPLMILDKLDEDINRYLIDTSSMFFYEEDTVYYSKLLYNIENHPIYNQLYIKPSINCMTIDRSIITKLPNNNSTFTFIDPFGYTGLTRDLLIFSVNKWGCDCLFNLNTSGLIRNIDNDNEDHLVELFGKDGLAEIKSKFKSSDLTGLNKSNILLDVLKKTLNRNMKLYFIPFRMEFDDKQYPNYHLVFITKQHIAFKIMKEVMCGKKDSESYSQIDGKGLPFFSSKTNKQLDIEFTGDKRYIELKKEIIDDFKGNTVSVDKILDHFNNKGSLFLDRNIKDMLIELEKENKVIVDPPREKRINKQGKVTLGDTRKVTFLED